jgi:hypothetical protein
VPWIRDRKPYSHMSTGMNSEYLMVPEYTEHVDQDERDEDDEGGEENLLVPLGLIPQQDSP